MGVVQNPGDLFGRQDGDADRPFLGRRDFVIEPGLLEDADVEKLQGCAIDLDGGPGPRWTLEIRP
jgi:hypothetical protein